LKLKVNEYQQKDIPEDRIDFYYRTKTKEVNDILDYLTPLYNFFEKRITHRIL